MRNPFKDRVLDNYAIKINFNKIKSRTNSINSQRSRERSIDPYQINKFNKIKVGNQYRTEIQHKKYLEKESLRVYGPQSLRYQPSYFENIEAKKIENNKFNLQQGNTFIIKKQSTSQPRDSDTISTLVKNDQFINADSYASNAFILESRSRRSLSINSVNGYNIDNQRTSKKKMSLYHRFKNQYPQPDVRSDESDKQQSYRQITSKSIKGNKSQKELNPITEDQHSRKSIKAIECTYKNLKTSKSIRSSKQLHHINKKKSPDKIKVKGKQFYVSPYYQI